MAELYRFFDSTEQDIREYTSSEFAEYFSRFLSDGVYTENQSMGLKVTGSGLSVTVGTGYAFIRGYLYKNDEVINLTLDSADTILHRIDRMVLRLDIVNRVMGIQLKKGTMGSNPQPPVLQDDTSIKELPIARIRVSANSSAGIITDERVPVSSLIEIPLEDILSDWEDFKTGKEVDYSDWMDSIQELLDESTAGNLLGLINDNADEIEYLQSEKMNNSKIKISSLNADVNAMNDGDIWIKYGDA